MEEPSGILHHNVWRLSLRVPSVYQAVTQAFLSEEKLIYVGFLDETLRN
jgi:hypothetical protein